MARAPPAGLDVCGPWSGTRPSGRALTRAPQELAGSEALEDAFALLNQDWELSETTREPALTLRRAAAALSPDTLKVRTDTATPFVVFVMADELDDSLSRRLRKTISAATQRTIERG